MAENSLAKMNPNLDINAHLSKEDVAGTGRLPQTVKFDDLRQE